MLSCQQVGEDDIKQEDVLSDQGSDINKEDDIKAICKLWSVAGSAPLTEVLVAIDTEFKKLLSATFLPRIRPFKPHFLLLCGSFRSQDVLPYKYRKILEMLLKLMELSCAACRVRRSEGNSERADYVQVRYHTLGRVSLSFK